MRINIFRKCGIILLLFPLLMAVLFMSGCIERASQANSAPSQAAGQQMAGEQKAGEQSSRLQVNFIPEVSSTLFRVRGSLTLTGSGQFPYLMLNATLFRRGQAVKSTRYLFLSAGPGADHSFEISKSMRMEPAIYNCTLEVSGPGGVMFSETRRCQAGSPQAGPASWTGAAASGGGAAKSVAQKAGDGVIRESVIREGTIQEDAIRQGGSRENGIREEEIVEKGTKAEDKKVEETRTEEIQAAKTGSEKAEVFRAQEVGQPGAGALQAKSLGPAENLSAESIPSSLAEPKIRLVGSVSTKKYHRPDCRYAQKIKPENRIYFASEEDAKGQNYQPCKVCSP